MAYPNLSDSRNILKETHALVKKYFPHINVVSDGWVHYYKPQRYWEFRGPNKFRWYGQAENGYDAKRQGWTAYLKSKGMKV